MNLIGATKTKSGLRVKAVLDTNEYETGVKVTKSPMEALCIRRLCQAFCVNGILSSAISIAFTDRS